MDVERREAGKWRYEVGKLGRQTKSEWQKCLNKLEKSVETDLNLAYSRIPVDGLHKANDENRCHHYEVGIVHVSAICILNG
ncbi:MAG: hypothetical protein HRU72_11385 [Planctomycetia bacterium]|nr:hypothetical protein [Candidatus Brocadia sp.]QOJ07098.1 MAG: hypothetical protein HRU72_11385 [Planctomycetia bacterium]TVL97846.1 MAG: hypothetical protein CV082_02520 [Candidatus Brocadia sp. BL1]HQU31434.1 hypothetical protein [Candidatus Brocadia sapporoensis]